MSNMIYMRYSDDVIEDVRSRNDIVEVISGYTVLSRKGSSYMGLCPFHNEKTPSFSVRPDKQFYYCFGCGAGGNVITFVMQKENYDFVEALKFLAARARVTLPERGGEPDGRAKAKEALYALHTEAARFFHNALMSGAGREGAAYLDKREVGASARRRFGLGFAAGGGSLAKHLSQNGFDMDLALKSRLVSKDARGNPRDGFYNRLMFPIFDVRGKVVGFGGRVVGEGEPKYLNSPDTPIFDKSRNLYGLNYARRNRSDTLIIVEGYMDVIALHQNGVTNAVASLGTAFNRDHAALVRKYAGNAVLLFDSDGAGEKAALRAIPALTDGGVSVKVLRLDGAKDPDEFLKAYGVSAFMSALSKARDHVAFQVNVLKKGFDLSDAAQKIRFANESAKLVSNMDNAIERDVYISEISEMTGIDSASIKKEAAKRTRVPPKPAKHAPYRPSELDAENGGKAADQARRNIIYIMSSDARAARAVRENLTAREMLSPFYVKLFESVCSLLDAAEPAGPAELCGRFETLDEQRKISNVFARPPVFDDDATLVKALNDGVRVVKSAFIDNMFKRALSDPGTDEETLKKWDKIKRNQKNSYITELDG